MPKRTLYNTEGSGSTPMPRNVRVGQPAETRPYQVTNNGGVNEIAVDINTTNQVTVTLQQNIPADDIRKLWGMAEFELVVTESVVENQGNKAVEKDVLTTRYQKLKPVGFHRDHENGVYTLVAATLSAVETTPVQGA